ncbi:MAG: DUF2442 domain-containing protein [Vulcanimicrobiota bacterium]
MLIRVRKVKYLDEYKLLIAFSDGSEKVFDMKRSLEKGGVFTPLRDVEYFKGVYVNTESRTIEWPNGVDICPDTLYNDGVEVKTKKDKYRDKAEKTA